MRLKCWKWCFRFGYVEYDSVDAAQKALNDMQGYDLDGRELFLDFAAERSDAPRGNVFWQYLNKEI